MHVWNGFQHGINFGGWFSQKNNNKEHLYTFIDEKDFATVAEWGLDHVRIPLDYDMVESKGGILRETGFQWIERAIQLCKKYHLNCVLHLHKAPGYSGDFQTPNGEYVCNLAFHARYISLWKEFARRFEKYSDMLAFEIFNLIPEESMEQQWDKFISHTISAIHETAPRIPVLVGGIYCHGVYREPQFQLSIAEPIVFYFHFFEPIVFTHQSAKWVKGMRKDFHIQFPEAIKQYRLTSAAFNKAFLVPFQNCHSSDMEKDFIEDNFLKIVQFAQKKQMPLYCSEYGVINQADTDSTLRWYQSVSAAFEKYQIGRAAWNYKDMDFGLIDVHMHKILHQIIPLL